MDYRLIEERSSGSGQVAAIERIYRCGTNFGAIVYQTSPGAEGFDRLLVTPIRFTGPNSEDYMLLHEGNATEGLDSGEILRPKFLFSDEDVETLIGRLCALGESQGAGSAPPARPVSRESATPDVRVSDVTEPHVTASDRTEPDTGVKVFETQESADTSSVKIIDSD